MLWRRVCLDDAVDFLGLPVDDTGNYECEAATGMLLPEPVTTVQFPPVSIFEIPCQGMDLLSFKQPAPVALAHLRVGHEIQCVFGTNDPAKLTIGTVEMVFS